MTDELSITIAAHDDTLVVRPSGQLDLEGASILKRALARADSSGRTVVIDLSEVSFIDSTAVSVLIGFQQHLAPPAVLKLRNLSDATSRLLHWTGLEETFQIDDGQTPLGPPVVIWRSRPEGDVVLHGSHAAPTPRAGAESNELSEDAATVVGLVSTAMPFAADPADQVERWLRALAHNGDAGFMLDAAGVGDRSHTGEAAGASFASRMAPDADPVAAVTDHAGKLARSHGERLTRSTDLLQAVRDLYGDVFEAVLRRHSTEPEDALERLNHLLVSH